MSELDNVLGKEQSFLTHLIELRDRLLKIVIAVIVVFVAMFPFANEIYHYIASPMMALLPEGQSMIATGVIAPFLTPFKLTLMLAFYIAIPVVLYQVWAFIAPGLYKHERKLVVPLAISSTILFYLGMVFAYYVVFPLVFAFLTTTAPEGVSVMPDMKDYLDFVLKLFFAFGVAFEVPVATILLVWVGATTPDKLKTKRPYIIVGAFVIGMLLTPPDIISQTLLAIPMWVLFEIGLFFSAMLLKQKKAREAQEEAEENAEWNDDNRDENKNHGNDGNGDDPNNDPNNPSGGSSGASHEHEMTDSEMEAELDRIEREEEEAEARKNAEFRAKQEEEAIDRAVDRARLDQFEAPIEARYEPMTEEEHKMWEEEVDLMSGEVTRKPKNSPKN